MEGLLVVEGGNGRGGDGRGEDGRGGASSHLSTGDAASELLSLPESSSLSAAGTQIQSTDGL